MNSVRCPTFDAGRLEAGRTLPGQRIVGWILAVVLFGGGTLAISPQVAGSDHGSVRIYKLNSKGQPVRQRWIRKEEEPGCHDFRGRREVHRFAQVGFAWCTVYSGDKCAAGTEMPAMWRGERYRSADIDISKPQVRLLPGALWYLHDSKNVEMGSWACYYE